ncbi:GSU2204 family CXXCH-containing (seleno)protein [Desulfuromonas thiophila]|uniref:Decaheme-associated outer membrane protein, MtrB/PioB family n=1 Tax=Desulfuromonas thiophila TaxID=57664 RepID=A0A1G6Z4X8_9BACT|nr:GSU2204 family CXXCH-containing (seleno)protein [Desulfuromonas thiophila]SDD97668.1 hypothetical protein SAMN05661003_102298 [Desulfuromonas thiophila]
MTTKKLGILLLVLLLSWAGLAGAADTANGTLELGYTGVSTDDSRNKTAEYESTDSSVGGALDLNVRSQGIGVELAGRYTDEEDHEASAQLDLRRVLRGSYDYQSFIHRLRHDLLFEEKDHKMKGTTNAFPQSIEHWNGTGAPVDPDYDIYNGVIAANAVPMMMENGAIGLEGLQTATFNDLDQGRDYLIERRQHKASAQLQLPAFPNLVPEVRFSRDEKHGWKQATLMTGQCTPCHTVAVGQKIDQVTEDVSIGATFKKGGLTASYFHTERTFDNRSDDYAHQGLVDNAYWYDTIVKGSYTNTFMSRELFENDWQEIGITADSEKKLDTVKLRYDADLDTTLYGSYVSATTRNNYSDLEYDADTLFFSLTNRSIPHLRLKAYGKHYKIDGDSLYVDLTGYSNNTTITFDSNGLGTVPVSYFNYTRPSSLSRDVLETGVEASYFINSGYSLTGAYTYKVVDRDNDTFKEYDSTDLLDEGYLEDETTLYHKVELSLTGRPTSQINLHAKYSYENADTPFSYANGLGYNDLRTSGWTILQDGALIETPIDTMMTNSAFYQILRSGNRTTSGSNVAENSHLIKASGTWAPADSFSLSLNGQYGFEDNNQADNDWQRQSWSTGISLFLMPTEKWTLSLGYNYQQSQTRSTYATAVYVGCFSESMGEQIASVYDDVDYDSTAQVLYLSTTFQATDKLTLTGDMTATKADARLGTPNFGDNIIYQNFVDVAVYGEALQLPYTQTIMTSYLDYSGSDTYSELQYETLDLSLGAQYRISEALSLGINALYRWVEDGEAYLGDDYDGELYLLNSSLSYHF